MHYFIYPLILTFSLGGEGTEDYRNILLCERNKGDSNNLQS